MMMPGQGRWIEERPVDAGCLERSLALEATCVGGGRYRVAGGRETHWVDLRSARVPRCDCGDHLWRDRVCKHMLAALLREGDGRVVREVGWLVAGMRRQLDQVAAERARSRRRLSGAR
jgi:hypothetical protein